MRNLSLKEMRKVAVMFVLFVSVAIASMSAISEKQSVVQQVGGVCAWMGDSSESHSGTWYYAAGVCGGAGVTIGYGALTQVWNPLGWVGGVTAGACLL